VPKQRKWLPVLIICVGLIAAPIVYLVSHLVRGTLEPEDFYRSRPILAAMQSNHDAAWQSAPAARLTLLQRMPLGTPRANAIGVLAGEGFECATADWPGDAAGRKRDGYVDADVKDQLVNCQLLAPAEMGYTRWIIDVWFDGADLLRGARVSVWNISL